jgi:enamine deaminase RidA (YjgF/YER057c/UK114 family)
MTIQRYRGGEKLSRIVTYNGLVYLCGQVANDYEVDLEEQTRQVLARIDDHLAEVGSDKTKMLSVLIHVKDISQVAKMNAIWAEWLGDAPRPARTCVQAKMAKPNILVEMTVTATL